MPREGVPYPERMLCSLKCELKNIWNALSGKLHSVNGVEGDGQGNVDIVSGDAAVVVTPQPLSNQVEISLDQSQLPAAAVTSVNGATGAVVLDGGDIEGVTPGQTVNQEITALTGAVSGLGGLISAETVNRQNADSALQNNINTVTASLPAAAAAAVAADPTVAQLAYDVTALQTADGNNVKLSGAQTITGNKSVPTQTTGQYGGQIASADKVKNELDAYAPMVRTTDNQTIAGIKTFESAPVLQICGGGYKLTASTYLKCGTIINYGDSTYNIDMIICERSAVCIARATVTILNNIVSNVSLSGRTLYGTPTRIYIGACVSSNGIDLYYHTDTVNRYFAPSLMGCFYSNGNPALITPDNTVENTQPTDYTEAIFTEA